MVQLIPSASNATGTALGSLVGAVITASAPSWPLVISGAALFGMTPVGLAGILALSLGMLTNTAVTHIAEVKNLNDKVAAWYPLIKLATSIKIDPTYPNGQKNPDATELNTAIKE